MPRKAAVPKHASLQRGTLQASEIPAPGCGNTAPPAAHPKALQEQDQRQTINWDGKPANLTWVLKLLRKKPGLQLGNPKRSQNPPRNTACTPKRNWLSVHERPSLTSSNRETKVAPILSRGI